ncbi:MAG: hypothetical protein HY692_05975, partial [Cyanobacteria bacterium NC_groundwater_1444_Ag_S-0.65um_54_12]|nr:hypothetical protein [Cyanobacteria bacterium NC_groundwater_1444_Ag_S-0.65um_54_12]
MIWDAPADATPVIIRKVSYDDARQRLLFELSGPAPIRTRRLDRRIILEILDARLHDGPQIIKLDGQLILALKISEITGNPPLVSAELLLAPIAEPNIRLEQTANRLFINIVGSAIYQSERDWELLPVIPESPLPALSNSRAPALLVPTPFIVSDSTRSAELFPSNWQPLPGYRSFCLLYLQQAEVLEDIPRQRVVGFPTGVASFELQQWLTPIFGMNLAGHFWDWQARGSVSVNRREIFGAARVA